MAEYIRREDAIKCIEGQCVDWKMWGNYESEGTLIEAYSAIDDLMEIPPADVAPVRHGWWIYDHWCEFKCSVCGEFSNSKPYRGKENYCPNCGAIMDGKCKESAGE